MRDGDGVKKSDIESMEGRMVIEKGGEMRKAEGEKGCGAGCDERRD